MKQMLHLNDGVYVYVGNTSGNDTYNVANWIRIKMPGDAIASVNGKTGPTVTLITDDIEEDASAITDATAGAAADTHNRYFTQARVKEYLKTESSSKNFLSANAQAELVYVDDELIISGNSFES